MNKQIYIRISNFNKKLIRLRFLIIALLLSNFIRANISSDNADIYLSDTSATESNLTKFAKHPGININDILEGSDNFRTDIYLLSAIESAKLSNDSAEISRLYIELANSKHIQCNYNEANKAYQNAKRIIFASKNLKEQANISYLIAGNYFDWSKYDKSEEYFEIAMELFQDLQNKKGIARTHIGLSSIALNLGDYELAIGHMQSARDIYIEIDNSSSIVETTIGIGEILESWGKYNRALAYYKLAYGEFTPENNNTLEVELLMHLGDVHLKKKLTNKALEYYHKALDIKNVMNNKSLLSVCYSNIGQAYFEKQQNDTALYYLEKALLIMNEVDDKKQYANSLRLIGEIHLETGKIELAKSYLLQSLELSQNLDLKEIEMEVLILLAELYEQQSDFTESYKYLKRYLVIKDIVFDLKSQEMINDFAVKYEAARIEKENEILKQKGALNALKLERSEDTRLFAMIFLVFIFIIFMVIIFFINAKSKERKKNYSVLAKKNKEITSQKEKLSELNKELIYSREQYRSIVENATIGMYQTHKNGKILFANIGLIHMLGYRSFEELKTLNLNDNKNRHKFIKTLEKHEKISGREDIWYRQDGSKMFVNESAWVVKDELGNILHYEGIVEDISKRKEAEVALTESRRKLVNINEKLQEKNKEFEIARNEAIAANKIKSQFIANVSHEIRTPMNSIIGFTELLSKLLEDKKHLSYISAIKSSSKSLLTLINDVLDLSKIQAGEIDIIYEPVNFRNLINDIEQLFKLRFEEKKLNFHYSIDKKIKKPVLLDKVRMRQILLNLIGNAINFTRDGDIYLTVTGELVNNEKINLTLSIEDTGIGIPESEHTTIFEAFKQSKSFISNEQSGTGLGLSISKRLVEVMGGNISLESKVDVGSKFTINLPDIEIASDDTQTSEKNFDNLQFQIKDKSMDHIVTVPVNISYQAGNEIQEEMISRFGQKWKIVKSSYVVNHIIIFGEELLEFAKAKNDRNLINVCESLLFYSNNFDIENINKLMDSLGNIFNRSYLNS